MNLRKFKRAIGKSMVVTSSNRKEIRVAAKDDSGRLEYGVQRNSGMSEQEAADYLRSKMPIATRR